MGRRAFTLIELLVVVAIIAILAAIALPNLLAAQVRAKVSRSQSDMRTLAVALESYAVTENRYPPHGEILSSGQVNFPAVAAGLPTVEFVPGQPVTTPVAYLSALPLDPLSRGSADPRVRGYGYMNSALMESILRGRGLTASAAAIVPTYGGWRLYASGPDGDRGRDMKQNVLYDPTNGTVSDGDLVRTQKAPVLQLAADEGS